MLVNPYYLNWDIGESHDQNPRAGEGDGEETNLHRAVEGKCD